MDDTGKAAFKPTWGALLAEVSAADPARRARTITFIDSAYTLGEMAAPLLAASLLSGFGLAAMLSVRIVLALATEVHSARLSHKTT